MAWNEPQKRREPTSANGSWRLSRRTVFHCLACVVIMVGGVFLICHQSPKEEHFDAQGEKMSARRIAEVKPNVVTNESPVADAKEDTRQSAKYVAMKSLSPEERMSVRADESAARPIDFNVRSNRVVNTATEQIMAWIFRTEVGELPPPLPKVPDHELQHMAEILMADNPILHTDSERATDAKETIRLAKKELAEYIKNGGDVQEFFRYYRGVLEQAYRKRQLARQSVQKVIREEPDIALDYLEKVNEQLANDGIKAITIHPKQLKHFGITE